MLPNFTNNEVWLACLVSICRWPYPSYDHANLIAPEWLRLSRCQRSVEFLFVHSLFEGVRYGWRQIVSGWTNVWHLRLTSDVYLAHLPGIVDLFQTEHTCYSSIHKASLKSSEFQMQQWWWWRVPKLYKVKNKTIQLELSVTQGSQNRYSCIIMLRVFVTFSKTEATVFLYIYLEPNFTLKRAMNNITE